MRKMVISWLLATLILTTVCAAEAQPAGKAPRIGFISGASRATESTRLDGLRQGLRDLGYVEGRNIFIEYRFADGKNDRLPGLAAELAGLKVDVIVAGGLGATRAARQAAKTTPIVMA